MRGLAGPPGGAGRSRCGEELPRCSCGEEKDAAACGKRSGGGGAAAAAAGWRREGVGGGIEPLVPGDLKLNFGSSPKMGVQVGAPLEWFFF